tara:strand:- start:6074 stop:6373 length:300 start_codon:yes stop_codon:yes gene_type:complete
MSEENKDELRIKYAPHLFEIKTGLFLNEKNLDSFKQAIDGCESRSHVIFIWMEKHFKLDYAKWCLERYENVDASFDEQVLSWELKKKEQENNYGRNLKK